jgi:hypothetical protein
MDIYHYHPESGALCGVGEADPSPLDDTWLIPAYATEITPPAPSYDGKHPFFVEGAWELREPELSLEEMVEADRAAAEAADTTPEYHRQRMMEYPPMTEFIDAMYWMRQGDESKMLEYEAKVSEVKDKYPKPGA